MSGNTTDTVHIVLRLRRADVESIDTVAAACRMTRTAWIRKSLFRNLAYTKAYELKLVTSPEVAAVLDTLEN